MIVSTMFPTEAALSEGKYIYMEDLLALEQGSLRCRGPIPDTFKTICTPYVGTEWAKLLASHPDRDFVEYILRGISEGFRVGMDPSLIGGPLQSAKSNMQSARDYPEVVDNYLEKECSLGRVVGPLGGMEGVHINRFGVIPKASQPGKWRLIVDLSHPSGSAVNDGISRPLCSLRYVSVDPAVQVITECGPATLLAKLDLESAYRNVPVHPADRWLLGMKWKEEIYVDSALPFGLRSAPKIFNAVADGLMWILGSRGVKRGIHYLDDFLFFGQPVSSGCADSLRIALDTCQLLGVPVATHKVVGPTTVLTFLGICLDTVKMEIRLPDDKLARLQDCICSWESKRVCIKRDLLSLLGLLHHASKVVPPGRTFLRRMIDTSMLATQNHHHIRLDYGFRSDLHWWSLFLDRWNGVRILSSGSNTHKAVVTSDASGSWGCGAFLDDGRWFQISWQGFWSQVHITVKELLPVVVACAVWGRTTQGNSIRIRCDNAAVVAILRSGTSKDKLAMHLMRCLAFFRAEFNLSLEAEHLPGRLNTAADALSRNNLTHFLQVCPNAPRSPMLVPQELVQALIKTQPDWTSVTWKRTFRSILEKV